MTKLDQLIKDLCPNGVEYKKIKDICVRQKGTPITASEMKRIAKINGAVRVFAAGNTFVDADYDDVSNVITVPSVIVKSRGNIGFEYYDKPFTHKNEMWSYSAKDTKINLKFLYHYLQNRADVFQKKAKTGKLPQISTPDTDNFTIPVPPIAVQNEIVRILDTFTELTAELTARKQQYEYYRNSLLNFENSPISLIKDLCPNGVGYKTLGELGEFYGGLTGKTKEDFKNGNAYFVTYKNIYSNPALSIDIEDKVKINANEKQNTVQYGDVLFTGSSETPEECGMSSVLTARTDKKLYLNSFCFGFRFKQLNLFNPDFCKHLFRSYSLRQQLQKTADGVTRFNVSKKKMAKVTIPVPPLAVQNEIVRLLDRFEALCNDISVGLPAEIKARQQQYEYYRNKLLTFEEVKA